MLLKRSTLNRLLLSAATIALVAGCAPTEKKNSFSHLLSSATAARASGHEDECAVYLKEAFERLPPKSEHERQKSIDSLYMETVALAKDLAKSGRLSLSKTMFEKAVEIEAECSISDKPLASELQLETEKIGAIEVNLLKRANKTNDSRTELKAFKRTTNALKRLYRAGQYKRVVKEGRAHLESMRKARGVESEAYAAVRNLVVNAMIFEDEVPAAIVLLEGDVPELSNYKDAELKEGDAMAFESAFFLSPLLGQIANLQYRTNQFDEAEKNAQKSLSVSKTIAKMSLETASSQVTLASILERKGDFEKAVETANFANSLLQNSETPPDEQLRSLYTLAQLQNKTGKLNEAKVNFQKLIELVKSDSAPSFSSVALAHAAVFYRLQDDMKLYSQLKKDAVSLTEREGALPYTVFLTYQTFGDCSVRFSKFSEALEFYTSALKHAPPYQQKSIEQKIASCKKNLQVES